MHSNSIYAFFLEQSDLCSDLSSNAKALKIQCKVRERWHRKKYQPIDIAVSVTSDSWAVEASPFGLMENMTSLITCAINPC